MTISWNTEITQTTGLTLFQWIVREAARCQKWADYYWDMIDGGNELSVTQDLIEKYTDVCNWMDRLEDDPQSLYDMSNG